MMVQLRSVSFTSFKNTTPPRSMSSLVAPRFGNGDQPRVELNKFYPANSGGLNCHNLPFVKFFSNGKGHVFASYYRDMSSTSSNGMDILESSAAGHVDWKKVKAEEEGSS